jgi:hypothetical protein
VARLSSQSPRSHGRDGFLYGPDGHLRVLYCFFVISHDRRRVLHFKVTEHPTAPWTAHQVVEALPHDTPPRYLLRDRDQIYGEDFHERVQGMGITEVKIAPQSAWQSPFIKRLVGSIRREYKESSNVEPDHNRGLRKSPGAAKESLQNSGEFFFQKKSSRGFAARL